MSHKMTSSIQYREQNESFREINFNIVKKCANKNSGFDATENLWREIGRLVSGLTQLSPTKALTLILICFILKNSFR